MRWRKVPIDSPLYLNLDEQALGRAAVAMENVFVNEAGGHTRIGNLASWAALPDGGRVFLKEWRGELVAATSHGRVYVIDRHGVPSDRTGVAVSIDSRPTFAETDDELLIAGGGPIVRLAKDRTDVLSPDAPPTTHVGYARGYILAAEKDTGLVAYNTPGFSQEWPVLSAFSAEDKPDPVTALYVNQFNEVLVAGPRSVELFQVSPSGSTPFYRRSSLGYGISGPHLMAEAGNAFWSLNSRREFARLGQVGAGVVGRAIGRVLEQITDLRDAWMSELLWAGQRFILLQAPSAATPYGGTGRTFAYDPGTNRWHELYAWDADQDRPGRWPVWSAANTAYGTFLGGEGAVYRLTDEADAAVESRAYYRTAPWSASSIIRGADQVYVDDIRLRVRRTSPASSEARPASLRFRACADEGQWSMWTERSLEQMSAAKPTLWLHFGQLGTGSTFQIEYETFADAPFEVADAEILAEGYEM